MSSIVATAGSSHTAMLAPDPLLTWKLRGEYDRKHPWLRDSDGNPQTYEELEAAAGQRYLTELSPDVWLAKHAWSMEAIDRLASDIEAAAPDLLLIVGDDQKELFDSRLQPALAIFHGATIRTQRATLPSSIDPDEAENLNRHLAAMGSIDASYPGDEAAGLHVIDSLIEQGFDVTSSDAPLDGRGFGHAFSWVLGRLLPQVSIPSVPVMLNTYFPPNQPTASRCYDLGRALRVAAESLPGERRVALIASGGLSHLTVNRDLDERVVRALRENDVPSLRSIPQKVLNDGTSEIRNWLVVAGASDALRLQWVDYRACFRSPAGTGAGIAFASWS